MGMFDKFPYRNTRDLNLNWIVKKIIYLEGVVGAAVSDIAQFLSKKGGKMEGAIDMQGNSIFNVPTPSTDNDVASKKYVDDNDKNYLPKRGGTLLGELNMNLNKIINVATPETFGDATTKKYVDDGDNKKLDLSGGAMTGAVNMGGNKITNAATPTADTDVATKKYVDDHSGVNSVTYYANQLTVPAVRTGEKEAVVNISLPFVIKNIPQGVTIDKVSLRYYNSGNQPTTIPIKELSFNRTGNIFKIRFLTEAALPSTNGLYIVNTDKWVISNE